jgi:pimeloyl-ACP methyl ester carboxylesterase
LLHAKPLLNLIPKGEPHGVMLLLGVLASDLYNKSSIDYLGSLNCKAVGWGQGCNDGPKDEVFEGVYAELEKLVEETSGKVTLIGHSLGGVYAREIARLLPDMVKHVITLGSHCGMTLNARVWYLLADRLRQVEGSWQPFQIDDKNLNATWPQKCQNKCLD